MFLYISEEYRNKLARDLYIYIYIAMHTGLVCDVTDRDCSTQKSTFTVVSPWLSNVDFKQTEPEIVWKTAVLIL